MQCYLLLPLLSPPTPPVADAGYTRLSCDVTVSLSPLPLLPPSPPPLHSSPATHNTIFSSITLRALIPYPHTSHYSHRPRQQMTHRMAFAHLLLFQVVATSLVNCHLTGLTAITLTTKPPYPLMAFLTVGCLEPLGHKPMPIDPPHLLPPPRPTTMVDTH